MKAWTLHDVRRTGRTQLGEMGIKAEVGEYIVGHVKGGIVGTYDLSRPIAAARVALDALARRYARIVEGSPVEDNVVAFG